MVRTPEATDPERFEDYARKMYPQYNRLNVPTWIIGPALGEGPLIERPADVLKVWPTREPIPTVGVCAIQSAPRAACYDALPLTLWPLVAQDSEKLYVWSDPKQKIEAGTGQALKVLKLLHLLGERRTDGRGSRRARRLKSEAQG